MMNVLRVQTFLFEFVVFIVLQCSRLYPPQKERVFDHFGLRDVFEAIKRGRRMCEVGARRRVVTFQVAVGETQTSAEAFRRCMSWSGSRAVQGCAGLCFESWRQAVFRGLASGRCQAEFAPFRMNEAGGTADVDGNPECFRWRRAFVSVRGRGEELSESECGDFAVVAVVDACANQNPEYHLGDPLFNSRARSFLQPEPRSGAWS